MRRTVLALLLGVVLGITGTISVVAVAGGWYEHRFAATTFELTRMVNDEGWEITPGQSSTAYLRRPRLRLGH